MPNRLTATLPVALTGLVLLAPAAHAATDVVANPTSGLSSVRLSDTDDAGKLTIRVTPTASIGAGHVSALFLDIDRDGDSDRVVIATGTTINILSTPQSIDACQQTGGTTASAVAGATASVATDLSSYTVKLPAAQVSTSLNWKATATAPTIDDLCGGTDGTVQGLAMTMAGARTFTADGVNVPPVDITPPGAPTGLTATAADTGADLDWADNAEADIAEYLVYRRVVGGGFTLVASPSASRLSDSGLTNGVTYEYYVRAKDAAGNISEQSSRVTVTPKGSGADRNTPPVDVPPTTGGSGGSGGETPITTNPDPTATAAKTPRAPRHLRVGRVTARTVALDWAARKGVVRYRVYRRLAGHAWSKKPLATVRSSAFVDHKAKPGTTYLYRIVGVTAKGKLTEPSKSIVVTTKHAARRHRR